MPQFNNDEHSIHSSKLELYQRINMDFVEMFFLWVELLNQLELFFQKSTKHTLSTQKYSCILQKQVYCHRILACRVHFCVFVVTQSATEIYVVVHHCTYCFACAFEWPILKHLMWFCFPIVLSGIKCF